MTHILTVSDIIRRNDDMIQQARQKYLANRPFIDSNVVGFNDFKRLLKSNAEYWMMKDNDSDEFTVDTHNEDVVEQLYLLITKSAHFSGSLEKGIWLWGTTGCGKSILMAAFIDTIANLTGLTMRTVVAVRIGDHVRNHGYDYFNTNLFIDDLGREERKVLVYGNETIPMMDIMFRIEKKGYFCLATSQHPIDNFNNIYGSATVRRFHATFNEFELKGPNRTALKIKK